MKKYLIALFLVLTSLIEAQVKNNFENRSSDILVPRSKVESNSPNSRNASFIPQVIPSSPQSQIFEKYINHKINESNGVPDISIPLYEVEIKGLKIPISLSYCASGIKYKQYDGELGAGWSINACGYRVSRTIYGKPDQLSTMYKEDEYNKYVTHENDLDTKDAYLSTIALNETTEYMKNFKLQDSKYDLFSYMMPSSTGHFIIVDRDNKLSEIIEQNQDKIFIDDSERNLKLNQMRIKDSNGYDYIFGKKSDGSFLSEEVNQYYINPEKIGWPLTQILSPFNESVDFKYSLKKIGINNPTRISLNIDEAPTFEKPLIESGGKLFASSSIDSIGVVYERLFFIDEIATKDEIVKFIRSNDNSNLIKEINIECDGKVVKSILFDYEKKGSHFLLKKVKIGNGISIDKVFSFNYYIPDNVRLCSDQWGYYGILRPEEISHQYNGVKTVDDFFLHRDFLDDEIVSYSNPSSGKGVLAKIRDLYDFKNVNWITRSYNNVTPNFYSLKSIVFPTGGVTEYEYEPNQYLLQNQVVKGAGQRIYKITSQLNNRSFPVTTLFKYGDNEDGNGYCKVPLLSSFFKSESLFYNLIQESLNFNVSFYRINTYSSSPINFMGLIPDFSVYYKKINAYQYDKAINQYNGKTSSIYVFLPGQYCDFMSKPVLIRRCFFSNSKLLKKEDYNYKTVLPKSYHNLDIRQNTFSNTYEWPSIISGGVHHYATSLFIVNPYDLCAYPSLISSKTVTQYDAKGDSIANTESYDYRQDNYQLAKLTQKNSQDNVFVTQYKYAQDFTDQIYREMVDRNMISSVIEKINRYNSKVEIQRTNYFKDPIKTCNIIVPNSIETFLKGRYYTNIIYDLYDKKGNLLQYTSNDGVSSSILWAYNYKYPIAKISNITYQDVFKNIGVDIDELSKSKNIDSYIDKIRLFEKTRPNVQVSIYKYAPLVGILEFSDCRGLKTAYEYNKYGYLNVVKDNNDCKIAEYAYNYTCLPLEINLNTEPMYILGNLSIFKISLNGGSGYFSYKWVLTDAIGKESIVGNDKEAKVEFSQRGCYSISCYVEDHLTGEKTMITRKVTVAETIFFSNIEINGYDDEKTITAEVECRNTSVVCFLISLVQSRGSVSCEYYIGGNRYVFNCSATNSVEVTLPAGKSIVSFTLSKMYNSQGTSSIIMSSSEKDPCVIIGNEKTLCL